MAWNRVRKVAYVVLCGGVVFQTTGCESRLASLASSLISSYVTEAITSGFLN